jgi:hypothetical protein
MRDMTIDKPLGAMPVLSALIDVDQSFADIARWLRQQPGIRRASHSVHTSRRRSNGEAPAAFVIAFYADAVHDSECGIDLILELTCADNEWLIESSVRGGGRDRDDVVYEFPARVAVSDEELLTELVGATSMLTESRASALQVFVRDYVGSTDFTHDRPVV